MARAARGDGAAFARLVVPLAGLGAVFAAKSPELMRLGKAAFVRVTDNGYRQGAAAAVQLQAEVGADARRFRAQRRRRAPSRRPRAPRRAALTCARRSCPSCTAAGGRGGPRRAIARATQSPTR